MIMDNESPRVLIVTPDPSQAEMITMQLRKADLHCDCKRAANRDGYQRLLEEHRPHLVISAALMPRYNVFQALRASREENPSLRWIIVDEQASDEQAVTAMKAGAADYVSTRHFQRLGAAAREALAASGDAGMEGPPAFPASRPEPAETPDDQEARYFREIAEYAGDLIALLDRDGKRLYNNPAYAAVLGEPAELRGTDSFVDVHPADREKIREVFQETVASGEGRRTEYRLMDEKGNARVIESQGGVVPGPDGMTARVVVVSRDVTARRRTEESLQNLVAGTSSVVGEKFCVALVRHLARSLGVRFALVSETVSTLRDRVRSVAYWADDRWVPAFEYDVKGTTCERVMKEGRFCYYPEKVQEQFPKMEALKAMHAACYMGIPLFGASEVPIGHLFIMDDKPLADPARTKYIMSLFAARAAIEIERMHQTKIVGDAELQFRSALEVVHDAVVITDLNDIILFTNRPLQALTGYTEREMTGKLVFSLLLPDEEWQESQVRSEQRAKGISEVYETVMKRKDGSRFPARISASPVRNDRGESVGIVGIIQELPAQ
jgi:PAS domain S-box-containing protein